ncbi:MULTISPECIES: (Fe-S)-binding protein [unclassified Janthinobacterium]|uniref:(Fe-S)-binding protein n=1 Tax=unclassified Janthinobacterium TaxID=2610881 RepID=UPI00034C2AB9|nr:MULTISPECIES: (Fe-S)-binding protein [unclassified Janthinobacterium]MEC5162071.1 Fe-S oxidoreductase [Janthinobacterium sp. CG_S6]
MLAYALTVSFWCACLLLLLGLARRARLWRNGRAAPLVLSGLLAVPKRYLVDLHHVVAREPFVANSHAAVAGGAVLSIAVIGVNYGLALYSPLLDRVLLLASAVMLGGSAMMVWRRRAPPARLSRGPWMRLPFSLAAFAVGAALAAWLAPGGGLAPAAVVVALLLFGTAELALGIGMGGPMKHAVAGLLHLAFHPRPERFAGQRSTDLKPARLERGEFGAAKPADFSWNRLLSFDSCVQCGKCEAACPALAAGQPLNPKKLIQDMVAGMAGKSDAQYAGTPYPGKPVGLHRGAPHLAIVPGLIDADTIWSCTTCRACVQECPMLIEHVDAVVEIRRDLAMVQGAVPGKGAQALENLRQTDTVGGFAKAMRYHWAIDLNVPTLAPGGATEWLLIAGEGAFDMRYQRALRALVKVLQHAGVQFAVLGAAEMDSGDLARRLGDEAAFQDLAKGNIALLDGLRFKHIVTPDPHVFHCLKNEYPALGGRYDVHHHSQLLAQLLDEGRIALKDAAPAAPLTYHDPCYLGRYNGEVEAPRKVLRALGIEVLEMERSKERGRCCGGGGGAPFTDIPGATRIPDIRIADARATGAATVAVACPNCTAMLEGVVGPRPEVMELAELLVLRLRD